MRPLLAGPLVLSVALSPFSTLVRESDAQPQERALCFETCPPEAASRFRARAEGLLVEVRPDAVVLRSPHTDRAQDLRLRWIGGEERVEIVPQGKLETRVSWFLGADPRRWARDLETYAELELPDLWPGIDLVLHGRGRALEYDFVVQPGSDPACIAFAFEGACALALEPDGALRIGTAAGTMRQRAPEIWQEVHGLRVPVPGSFRVDADGRIGFAVGQFDARFPLVIDPVVDFATYLGGGGADSNAHVATDAQGNTYCCGSTDSIDFPAPGGVQGPQGGTDAFVAKLRPDGQGLVWATYLGGAGNDNGNDLVVLQDGRVALCGVGSSGFPLQGAHQTTASGTTTGFVALLAAAGNALEYASFLGGNDTTRARGIAAMYTGELAVTGTTNSTSGFPLGAAPFQSALGGGTDAFLCVYDPRLSGAASLRSGTYLGGASNDEGHSVAAGTNGRLHVTGQTSSASGFPIQHALQGTYGGGVSDAYLTVFEADGTNLVYSTYLGGSSTENRNASFTIGAVAIGPMNRAFVTGETLSTNLLTSPGAFQTTRRGTGSEAFVACIDPARSGLASRVYLTYYGGSRTEQGRGIDVDARGNAAVCGPTSFSTDLPLALPVQNASGGSQDAFVAVLNPSGSGLLFATYLGGTGFDEGLDVAFGAQGRLHATGNAGLAFPTTAGAFQGNAPGGGFDVFAAAIDLGCAMPEHYGTATAGSGGFAPRLEVASGLPVLGNLAFTYKADQLTGGAPCLLLIGLARTSLPIAGFELLVNPFPLLLTFASAASGTTAQPGAGHTSFAIPIPPDPSATGTEIDAQILAFDAGATAGLAASDGLAAILCEG